MTWKTGTVRQLAESVISETKIKKCCLHCEEVARAETTYTFLVELDGGGFLPLAGTASREPQLPLLQVGDRITFARARGTYALMFSQLTIDFRARTNEAEGGSQSRDDGRISCRAEGETARARRFLHSFGDQKWLG